jgi:hypothetical protein
VENYLLNVTDVNLTLERVKILPAVYANFSHRIFPQSSNTCAVVKTDINLSLYVKHGSA